MTPEPPISGFLNPPDKSHTPAGLPIPEDLKNDPQFSMNMWEVFFCDGQSVSFQCVLADVVYMLNTSKMLLFSAPDGTQWNIAAAQKFMLYKDEDEED